MLYENNWNSLNARSVPAWFEDAKFGIFIHWGLYSVPAYGKRDDYAEWYGWSMLQNDKPDTTNFHNRVYGPQSRYADFVKDFRAELFDAEEWTDIFRRAGAKYINLVSKHHDGFCMYKTNYAWNWNSVDVGPHRDFCGELSKAMENSGVRFGVYHSVYEWFHPLYLENPERYATEHLIPMLKELMEQYHPSTLFTDGEWAHPSSTWHSTEFLQWLYNESSVRDFIVPNDRWGSETRGHLGGNLTTEYGTVDGVHKLTDLGGKPFEECRGIGHSFGLNRAERAEDYLTGEKLVEMLCDLVSKGGNLLLNVGPSADGKIPPIMEDRLMEIGKWLEVNGEAIYGSRKFTDNEEDGVWYTRRGDTIYALLRGFPFGDKTLKNVPFDPAWKATLLCDPDQTPVTLDRDGDSLRLRFAPMNPDRLTCKYVYAVRLEK